MKKIIALLLICATAFAFTACGDKTTGTTDGSATIEDYNTAISKSNYSMAQAKPVLFFLILASVSIIQVRISNSKEVEL